MSEPTEPQTLDRVLDAALARAADEPVQFDVAAGRNALAAALRERAEQPAGARPHRRVRWLAAAAAVGVLTAGGLSALTVGDSGSSATAAEELTRAADLAARVVERPIAPGQYRYVRTRYDGITVEYGSDKAYRTDMANEQWIPADRRDEWKLMFHIGSVKWLPGHEGEGKPDGGPFKDGQEFVAKCGMYSYFAEGYPDRCTVGSFSNPTPGFVAALPKDPKDMLAKLREAGHADDAGAFAEAREALRSGQYPAEVRATIFRALALLPGLVVTDKRANLDGKEGVALGKRYYDDFAEIIIDPANGDFIGTREVVAEDQADDKGGLKKGTVRQSSAVTTAIVGSLGARP
ncbi:CU044_5270 family protein [Lentzea sp. NPDC004782]|uniref:CU044_5270 family protein n=1 Tax=Lentzea sp. NPDC004782 TaxID=3154458 RepID=UPI0033AF08F8